MPRGYSCIYSAMVQSMKVFSMEDLPKVKGNFTPEHRKWVFFNWSHRNLRIQQFGQSYRSPGELRNGTSIEDFSLILFLWRLLNLHGQQKLSQLEVDHYQLIVLKSRTHQLQAQAHPPIRRLPRRHSCHCSQSFTKRKCLRKVMLWNKPSHGQKKKRWLGHLWAESWIKFSKKRVKWKHLGIHSVMEGPMWGTITVLQKDSHGTVPEDLQSLRNLQYLLLEDSSNTETHQERLPDIHSQHKAVT